jgi:hypothetical protein
MYVPHQETGWALVISDELSSHTSKNEPWTRARWRQRRFENRNAVNLESTSTKRAKLSDPFLAGTLIVLSSMSLKFFRFHSSPGPHRPIIQGRVTSAHFENSVVQLETDQYGPDLIWPPEHTIGSDRMSHESHRTMKYIEIDAAAEIESATSRTLPFLEPEPDA